MFTINIDTLIMIGRLQRSYTGNWQVDSCIPQADLKVRDTN